MAFTIMGTSPNQWISQNAGTTDDDSTLATFITSNSAGLNGSSVIAYTAPDGGVRRTININAVGATNGADLTDSSGGLLFIQGTFNHNARLNNYIYGVSQNGNTGTWVIANAGVLNMTGSTVAGLNQSGASNTHLASFRGRFYDGINSFVKVNAGGTVNTTAVGVYANQAIVLAGRRNNTATFGSRITTWNDTGSTIRLGADSGNTNMLVRSDQGDGPPTFPGTIYNNRYILNGTTFVDTVMSVASAYDNTNSAFNNLRFLRETAVPVGQRGAALNAIQVFAPQNFVGIDYGTYDSHICSTGGGAVDIAQRNTQYGYRTGLAPRVGKVADFNNAANWFELRKQLNLTVRDATGALVTGMNSYVEDSPPSFAGGLAQVNVQTYGSYTGTFTGSSTSNALAGGTGGTIVANFVNGVFQGCVVGAAGSGYTADITNFAVNATNFPGLAGVSTAANVTISPAIRRAGSATIGQPNWQPNFVYSLTTTNGLLGRAVGTSNPTRPLGTNTGGTALTGVDLLLAGANYSLIGFSSNPTAQAINQVDYRFNTGTYLAPAYNITLPLRGYLFNDSTTTINLDGLTQNTDSTVFVTSDTFVVATGINATTAATYSDVQIQTPAPTRGPTSAGNTSGALIPSTTGAIASSQARTLDQVYAKIKAEYTRGGVDTTAGTVTRTQGGFGIAPFLSASGALTNATMSIGGFSLNAATGALSQGTVFKGISTTGNATIAAPGVNGTWANVVASTITLATGQPGTWNTSFTPTLPLVGGNTPIQIGGLGALGAPGPAQYTPTGQTTNTPTPYNGNRDRLQQALSAVLPAGSIVTAGTPTGTQTWSGTFSFSTATWNGFDSTTILTTDTTFLGGSGLQTTSTGQFLQLGPTGPFNTGQGFNLAQGLITRSIARMIFGQAVADLSYTFTFVSGLPATNFAPNSSYSIGWTLTAASTAVTGNAFDAIASLTVSGTNATWINSVVSSPILISGVTYPMTFSLPAVGTPVVPAPTFTTSRTNAIINAVTTNITPSGVSVGSANIVQNLTASQAILGMNTTGNVVSGPSAASPLTVNVGQASNIVMTGDLVFNNAVLSGTIQVNPNAGVNRVIRFVGCDTTNLALVNPTPTNVIGLNGYQGPSTIGFSNFSVIQVTADRIGGTWRLYNGATVLQTGTVTQTSFQITAAGYTGLVWSQVGNVPIQKQYANSLINNTFDIAHGAIIGGAPLATTQIFTTSLSATNQLVLTTTTGVATSALATAGVFTRDSICNLYETANFQAMINAAGRAATPVVVTDILTVTNANAITMASTYIQFRSSPTTTQLYVGGILANTTNGFPDLTALVTSGAGTIPGVYQILNWPNSTVDTGAIIPAVREATAPQFAKLDSGVVKASLVIPYAGSTYP